MPPPPGLEIRAHRSRPDFSEEFLGTRSRVSLHAQVLALAKLTADPLDENLIQSRTGTTIIRNGGSRCTSGLRAPLMASVHVNLEGHRGCGLTPTPGFDALLRGALMSRPDAAVVLFDQRNGTPCGVPAGGLVETGEESPDSTRGDVTRLHGSYAVVWRKLP